MNAQEPAEEKSFLKKLAGEELPSSFTCMPFGTHTDDFDFNEVWYIGIGIKSFEISYFVNSHGNPSFGLMYKRAWNFTNRFSMGYGGGIIYGYHGKLQYVDGVPFRNTFLFKNEINPVIGIELDYKVLKNISIHSSIAPLVIIYGFKYYF